MQTNGPTAKCYPTKEQYERWKGRAEVAGMSVPEFIAAMVEAGQKTFAVNVDPDEAIHDLRRERDRLSQQLEDAQDEIDSLEKAIHCSEAGTIKAYINENPGCTWGEIVDAVTDGTRDRVTDQLEILEGRMFRRDERAYYPLEEGR